MFYLILLLFLLVCGGLVVLTMLNFSTQVHLVAFSWQSPDMPIGMWLLIAFFVGALFLYLVSIVSAWSDRRELKHLHHQIVDLQQQLRAVTAPAVLPHSSEPVFPPHPVLPMPNTNAYPENLSSQEFR